MAKLSHYIYVLHFLYLLINEYSPRLFLFLSSYEHHYTKYAMQTCYTY